MNSPSESCTYCSFHSLTAKCVQFNPTAQCKKHSYDLLLHLVSNKKLDDLVHVFPLFSEQELLETPKLGYSCFHPFVMLHRLCREIVGTSVKYVYFRVLVLL